MPELDIPAAATPLLLKLSLLQKDADLVLTIRQAKWSWIIHCAAPELESWQVLSIATHYDLWDFIGEREGLTPMHWNFPVIEFLDGLLTYRPWTSEDGRRSLVDAIPGKVPFPSGDLVWAKYAYCLGASAPDEYSFSYGSPRKVVPLPPPFFHDQKSWHDTVKEIIEESRRSEGGGKGG